MRFWSAIAVFSCSVSAALAVPMGMGDAFDVLVRRDFTANGTHVHGSTAVGGSLVLKGNMSEFGNQQPTGTGANVVVNGQISQGADARVNRDGIVKVGSLKSNQTVNGSHDIVGGGRSFYANNTAVGSTGLDTEAAFEDFLALSTYLAGLEPTLDVSALSSGSAPNKNLNLSFGWEGPFQVLGLTGNELKQFANINVTAPGTTPIGLIINVDLTGYSGGAFVQNRNGSDAGADWILWNFYGASSLTIQNQFYGTIFAPGMTVTHTNNDLKGAVIADTFIKNSGQIHRHRYAGNLPPSVAVPDAGATAGMVGLGLLSLLGVRRWLRNGRGRP